MRHSPSSSSASTLAAASAPLPSRRSIACSLTAAANDCPDKRQAKFLLRQRVGLEGGFVREMVGKIFTAGGRTHRRARIKRYDTPRWPDVRLQTFFVVEKRSTHGHHTTKHTCRILWCSVLFCFVSGERGMQTREREQDETRVDTRKGRPHAGGERERESMCGGEGGGEGQLHQIRRVER